MHCRDNNICCTDYLSMVDINLSIEEDYYTVVEINLSIVKISLSM